MDSSYTPTSDDTAAGSRSPVSSYDSAKEEKETLDVDLVRAKAATAHEHSLGVLEAVGQYKPAILWSLLFCLGVVMAGFDPQLISSLIAVPAFKKQFGSPYNGSYIINAGWQSGFNLAVPIGQIFGAFLIGFPLEKYGRKLSLAICCVLTAVGIAVQVAAQDPKTILAGEVINGVVRGAYPVIAPVYISEVTPVVLRGITGALVNVAFVLGQMIASAVCAGTQHLVTRFGYDVPFGLQWIFPIIIMGALWWCPESPYWLVRKDRIDDARNALNRLTSNGVDTEMLLSNIRNTTTLEAKQHNTTRYQDCLRSTNLRRTLITIMVFAAQPLSGSFFMISYATYFFELAGIPTAQAFYLGLGLLAVGLMATIFSWFLTTSFGRRPIFNTGMITCTVILAIVGIIDVVPGYTQGSSAVWAQCSFMVIYNFAYDLTIGPICYVILGEVSSAQLREKTIAIGTGVNAIVNLICAVGVPYGINPDSGNLRGKMAFVFLGTAVPCAIWSLLALPETMGRTFEELDRMFEKKIPARQFGRYEFKGEGHTLGSEAVVPVKNTPDV